MSAIPRPLLPTFNFNNLCSKIRFKDSKQNLPFLSHLFICRILFIEAYKPTISHYRSAHAPLRRYLPFEITIQSMYEDFKIKTESKISYLTFYTIFKKMNISLAHLGHEECELCETHELHKKNCTCVTLCDISKYVLHRKRYKKARMEYTTDSKSKHSDDEIFTSADLQKVIMLPQMECFKEAIFTRRLTVFNETFAELGSGKRDIAALRHEGISGRQDEDLASTFHSYMLKMRDLKRVVFLVGQLRNAEQKLDTIHHVAPTSQQQDCCHRRS